MRFERVHVLVRNAEEILGLAVSCQYGVHDISERVVGSLDLFCEEFWQRDRGLDGI